MSSKTNFFSSCKQLPLFISGLASDNKEWESSNAIRDMIVEFFAKNSPVEPTVDNNWKIVGVDLNLKDYDALIKQASETDVKITENDFLH